MVEHVETRWLSLSKPGGLAVRSPLDNCTTFLKVGTVLPRTPRTVLAVGARAKRGASDASCAKCAKILMVFSPALTGTARQRKCAGGARVAFFAKLGGLGGELLTLRKPCDN